MASLFQIIAVSVKILRLMSDVRTALFVRAPHRSDVGLKHHLSIYTKYSTVTNTAHSRDRQPTDLAFLHATGNSSI